MNLAVSVVEISEYQGWGGKDNPLGLVDTFLIDIFVSVVFTCLMVLTGNRMKCIKWALSFPTCPCQAAPMFTSEPELAKAISAPFGESLVMDMLVGGDFKEVLELNRGINSVQIWV